MKREVRMLKELRADGAGDELALCGYAAKYGVESSDLGGFREIIAPTAFVRSLKENADVKATFNHNPDKILGRTTAGTLTLSQDDKGLLWRCQLDRDNQSHKDIYSSVKRGDLSECSFAFMVAKDGQKWEERKDADGSDYLLRTLTDVDLMDTAVVAYPAYPQTSVDARSQVMWPDGEIMEIRSAIDAAKAKKPTEKRDEPSFEDYVCMVADALREKFPADDNSYYGGKYYSVETYDDYVIVQECGTDNFFKVPYVENADGTFVFGTFEPIEKEWVPKERSKKRLDEFRAALAAFKPKPQERAHSQEHVEGDCPDPECACQNRMVDPEDVWCEDDPEDGWDESERKLRSERKLAFVAELRKASDKVLTKSVDGKNLTADKFAFVGDPEKTETWKLPIMDKDHAQNALARFDQTQGIPAAEKANVYRKIVAAAKKFGIDVSADDSARMLRELPFNEDEVRKLLAKAALIRAEL